MHPNVVVFAIILGACNCVSLVSERKADPSVQVKTKNGIVQGLKQRTKIGTNYYSFRGIPFAKPPLNKLRFRPPQPSDDWDGVLDATKDGFSCNQIFLRVTNIDNVHVSLGGQENCLFINVYTPKNPHEVKKLLPVMVWIYGGAFLEGSSIYDIYGPDHILDDSSVIIVSFNYRVGAFGFLSTGDLESPGNIGLKDQVLALRWVKSNIKHFGGDPNQVTIFGESAGAASVVYLMLSPKSQGLFQAAIAQSGTPLTTWGFQRNARKVAFDIGEALGISTSNSTELLTKLRNADVSDLESAQLNSLLVNIPTVYTDGIPFAPVVEPDHPDAFWTTNVFKAIQNGQFSKVPLILGVNSNEASIYFYKKNMFLVQSLLYLFDLSPQQLVQPSFNLNDSSCCDTNTRYPDSCKRQLGIKIRNHYLKSGSFVKADSQEIVNLFTDEFFFRPILKTAELMSEYIPVYFYRFDYEGLRGANGLESFVRLTSKDKGFGPAHSEETWYLFRQSDFGKLNKFDKKISDVLVKLWTNFAKYRNPTPLPETLLQNMTWPLFYEKGPYLVIDQNLDVQYNFNKENREFWENLYKMHSQGPINTY